MGNIGRALLADFEAADALRRELVESGRADPTISPGDPVLVANALVWHMGIEWPRADMVAYVWLSKGGQPVQVADELRRIANVLERDPVEYMQEAIRRLIADLRARCPECDEAAA